MGPREIELKLRVEDLSAVTRRLERQGYHLRIASSPETSTLWDREGALRARGEALRVRSHGGSTLLTWKGPRHPDPELKIREEIETEVADQQALEAILAALGLNPTLRMVKGRALWEGQGVVVSLDRTPFGQFVELEGDPSSIQAAREGLELQDAPVETRSYPELYLEDKKRTS